VSRLEKRRQKNIEVLRTKAKEDDVNPDLLRETARLERDCPMQAVVASQFESLFDERLKKYDVDQEEVKREQSEQDHLLKRVEEANTNFQNAKKGDSSSKEREQALQNLENAYTTYKEILRNLDTGRKFYNDLSVITTRFRDECKNFVYTRRTEAQQLESDLSTAMAGLQLQQSTQQSLRNQRQQQQHIPSPARMVEEPIPAPTPQRPVTGQSAPAIVNSVQSPPALPMNTTWSENMPIVFGGPQASSGASNESLQPGQGSVDRRWDAAHGVKFGR
jgi:programmed cell death 6-interacting protein